MGNTPEDRDRIQPNLMPETGSIFRRISVRSAQSFLLEHTEVDTTIADIRAFMRGNQALGRLVIHTGGALKVRGVAANDAYALGVIHGIQLAERQAQEDALQAHLDIPATPHALDDQNN